MVSWLGVPVETFVREVRAKPMRRSGIQE